MNTPTNPEALPLTNCSAKCPKCELSHYVDEAGKCHRCGTKGIGRVGCYSDHLIAALRCLDDDGLRLLTIELAKRIGGTAGNRGMCLRHHEWDRTTISGMTCIHCKETTDTAHFIYEPNV